MTRVMPEQKPGRSVQEVGTPRAFLDAVELSFGQIVWDLAADESNHVVPGWFGPRSPWAEDAFTEAWPPATFGLCWLNPPYADIGKWTKKCAEESESGSRIALLIPAAVGTNYFLEHIFMKSRVFFLSPRLTFVGHTQSYPKDLILCIYGEPPGFGCFRWKP